MFESGAGTAPTLAGQDKANPLGRILTGALMLRHIGAVKGAAAIEEAVNRVLHDGYRSGDLFTATDDPRKVLGTSALGEKVLAQL
jgi:3-isopropylmalate dehydrogenase